MQSKVFSGDISPVKYVIEKKVSLYLIGGRHSFALSNVREMIVKDKFKKRRDAPKWISNIKVNSIEELQELKENRLYENVEKLFSRIIKILPDEMGESS